MQDNRVDNKSEKKSKKNHNIIVIKNNMESFAEIADILKDAQKESDFTMDFVSLSDFLEHLSKKEMPFPSFIICMTDSENKYRNILNKAGEVYPETRRMLIAQSSERDMIIDSLNNDLMHFCLIYPFSAMDFLSQIKVGFGELKHGNTWEYTKRMVEEQASKMYKLAKTLKAHDLHYSKEIDEKKIKYKQLKVKLEKAEDKSFQDISIRKYLTENHISFDGDGLKIGFEKLAKKIEDLYQSFCLNNSIEFEKEQYSEILKNINGNEEINKDNLKIINDIIDFVLREKTGQGTSGSDVTYNKLNLENSEELQEQLDDVLEIEMDGDRLTVRIAIKDKDSDLLTVENIFEYLRKFNVSYGLISEQTLLTWLENKASIKKLIVAKGTPPELPVDGKVSYYFDTNFIHAGKVKADGSIDFRERGQIPFVEEKTLLAEKVPAQLGKPGIDVSGAQIAIVEPFDPVFVAGDNTFESEEGLKIYAEAGGQPHLDAMGVVSVAPVLNIGTDVDFETGNVSFKGSIIVNGAVKEGFKVEGTNLTAQQIEGAEINLTGDLNVSAGVIDSDIKIQGNIQAKYINNSNIESFGDLGVTTEILDSNIILSGKCNSPRARIIASKIVAKGGAETGDIGSVGSKPVIFRVGVDDYIESLIREINDKLNETKEQIKAINDEIDKLHKEDEKNFKIVSDSAYVQDRTQLAIKDFKKQLVDLEGSGNAAEIQIIKQEIEKLEEDVIKAEKEVEHALDNQDKIVDYIKIKESMIEKLEEKNIGFINKKKALSEYSEKNEISAKLIVNGKLISGTRIEGQSSSLTIRDDTSRCKIVEIGIGSEGVVEYYEMQLIN